jgi:hypothetical protein
VTLDAHHAAVLDKNFVQREALADFRSGFGRGIDEKLVEHRSSRAVTDRSIVGARRPGDRDRIEVKSVGGDRGAFGRRESIQQPPFRQGGYPDGMDDVRGKRVAWKPGAIDQQNSVAVSSEQHCGR